MTTSWAALDALIAEMREWCADNRCHYTEDDVEDYVSSWADRLAALRVDDVLSPPDALRQRIAHLQHYGIGGSTRTGAIMVPCHQGDSEYVRLSDVLAALRAAQENERLIDPTHLANVLCWVSQIFNGWRDCEEWSKWDEEVAQAAVAIQRQIELLVVSPKD